jgi:hypothetical protein
VAEGGCLLTELVGDGTDVTDSAAATEVRTADTAVVAVGTAVLAVGTAVVAAGTAVLAADSAVVAAGTAVMAVDTAVVAVGTAVLAVGTAVVAAGTAGPSLDTAVVWAAGNTAVRAVGDTVGGGGVVGQVRIVETVDIVAPDCLAADTVETVTGWRFLRL